MWKYINVTQNMQFKSKLKASQGWRKNHLKNPLKCIKLIYKIELRNRVTQNHITFRVANLIGKLLFFHFQVTYSKWENKKFHFESLIRWINFYFFAFWSLTRTRILSYTSKCLLTWKIKIQNLDCELIETGSRNLRLELRVAAIS